MELIINGTPEQAQEICQLANSIEDAQYQSADTLAEFVKNANYMLLEMRKTGVVPENDEFERRLNELYAPHRDAVNSYSRDVDRLSDFIHNGILVPDEEFQIFFQHIQRVRLIQEINLQPFV